MKDFFEYARKNNMIKGREIKIYFKTPVRHTSSDKTLDCVNVLECNLVKLHSGLIINEFNSRFRTVTKADLFVPYSNILNIEIVTY